MENLETLYKKLDEYSNFEIEENCEKFLDIAEEIVSHQNLKSVKILLKYFDDNSDFSWILESLKNILGCLSKENYINGLIINLEELFNTAPRWSKSLFYPILNTPEYLAYLEKKISLVPSSVIRGLLMEIERKSPDHKTIALELIEKLRY